MISKEILANVKRIEIRTRRLVDELTAGAYQSRFKGRGIEFSEIREYVEGDDVRTIDWNVSAKTGKTYVKQFTEERELTVFLLVDISASGDFGSTSHTKNQLAAELVALLSFSAIRNKDKVGLMLFSDREELHLPPRKGRKHVLRLTRELLVHQRQSNKTNIKLALDRFLQANKRRTVCFLISDLMDEGFEKSLLLASQKHDITVIQLIDPFELETPKTPLLAIEDSESNSFSFFKGRGKKTKQAESLIDKNKELCKRCGVDILQIRSDENYVDHLVRFFDRRGKR